MSNVVFDRSDFALMHDLLNHALERFQREDLGQPQGATQHLASIVDKIEAIIAMGDSIEGGGNENTVTSGPVVACANCGHHLSGEEDR